MDYNRSMYYYRVISEVNPCVHASWPHLIPDRGCNADNCNPALHQSERESEIQRWKKNKYERKIQGKWKKNRIRPSPPAHSF